MRTQVCQADGGRNPSRPEEQHGHGLGVLRGLQTLGLQFKTKFWEERNPVPTVYPPGPGTQ